jgi:phage I-like protein
MTQLIKSVVLLGGTDKQPPKEFCLFTFGTNETLKGDFILTRPGAQEVMMRYREHGVDLMLDYEHHSLDPDATPEQKKASGWGQLELRADGLHLVNIKWTPKATEYLKSAEFRYLSPAFNVNDENEIVELINVALTNLPATHDQAPLVAASRKTLNQEKHMDPKKISQHLSAAFAKLGGSKDADGEFAKRCGLTPARLTQLLSGGDMTTEEMNSLSVALGLHQGHNLEHSELPIDHATSMNGVDVNKTKGSESDHEDHLSGLFQLMGGEAHVPHDHGEADESQGGHGLHLSKLASDAIVKLAGTTDPKKLGEIIVALKASSDANAADSETLKKLRAEIAGAHRENLITAHKAKLNPNLIALARRMPVKDMKDFLEALPGPVELHEPNPNAGGSRMVTLTREDEEVAKLSGKSKDEFAKIKESVGDEQTITLAGQRAHAGVAPPWAGDKAPKTTWDARYAEHFMSLSLTDMTPDGKPWKCAVGSKFSPASKLPA